MTPITSEAQLDAIRAAEGHMHCAAGCDKGLAEWVDGVLRCAFCHALFVECTPEICGDH